MTPQQLLHQSVLTEAHYSFQKNLTAHAFYKVNDHSLSDDLVQDTFLKTWKYLVKGGKIDLMKAFLYHVLNNLIIDEYRKHKATSLDFLTESGYEPSVDDSEKFINFMDGRGAQELIKKLPIKYQEIMKMRYVRDLSLEEMSDITGQSRNTIGVQLYRGLEKLKHLFDPGYKLV